jgi:hypothetical protein
MKIILSSLITLSIFYSCRREGDAGTAVYGVLLHFVDSNSNDLYSTDGTRGFWKDSIKLYDITGQKKPLPKCFDDNTQNVQFQQFQEIRTTICPNTNIVNRYSYTLIHLKNGVDDTIKCHLDHDKIGLSTNYDGIWYNGIQKTYDTNGNITIMK